MCYKYFIYLLAFSFSLSLILTKLIIKVALMKGVVDKPAQRKIHSIPVPLLGGVAIYTAFVISVLANLVLAKIVLENPGFFPFVTAEVMKLLEGAPAVWQKLRVILYGGTVMALLGFLDDIRPVSAKKKLLVQFLAATMLLVFGIRITIFLGNVYIGSLITVLWVVAITNAFNLLDNMDGLSSGVAVIAALLFLVSSIIRGNFLVSAVLVVFAGSILGFLRYNFNPAKIFMGDAGSLFIGYILSSLTIINTYYTEGAPTFFPVLMPVLILAVPIYDTASVIFLRIKNSESIFKPDRRHFSHRLAALGFTHRQAVMLVYLVSFCAGASSILLLQVGFWGAMIILSQVLAVFGIIIALESAAPKKAQTGPEEPAK